MENHTAWKVESVRIPDSLAEKMEKYIKEQGIRKSDFIRVCINEGIKREFGKNLWKID